MLIVAFEDRHVDRLYPITIGRAAYNITCGSYRLLDWLSDLASQHDAALRVVVRPHLREIVETNLPNLFAPLLLGKRVLLVNARAVAARSTYEELARLVSDGRPGVVRTGDDIAADF